MSSTEPAATDSPRTRPTPCAAPCPSRPTCEHNTVPQTAPLRAAAAQDHCRRTRSTSVLQRLPRRRCAVVNSDATSRTPARCRPSESASAPEPARPPGRSGSRAAPRGGTSMPRHPTRPTATGRPTRAPGGPGRPRPAVSRHHEAGGGDLGPRRRDSCATAGAHAAPATQADRLYLRGAQRRLLSAGGPPPQADPDCPVTSRSSPTGPADRPAASSPTPRRSPPDCLGRAWGCEGLWGGG